MPVAIVQNVSVFVAEKLCGCGVRQIESFANAADGAGKIDKHVPRGRLVIRAQSGNRGIVDSSYWKITGAKCGLRGHVIVVPAGGLISPRLAPELQRVFATRPT